MVGRQHVHGSRGIWNKGVNPKRKPSVNSPIELDCHLTQKQKRDAARTNPGGQPKQKKPKVSKAERNAENAARKRSREASYKVIIERRGGTKPSDASTPRMNDLSKLPDNEDVQRAAKRVLAIQTDIATAEGRLATLKSQLGMAMDKLKIAQNLTKPIRQGVRRKKVKPKGSSQVSGA